jgi:hypothetical protein
VIADDYAVVNQGQVKHIAKQAYEEMEARLPGGAGSTLNAIWAVPAASTDDYRAINLGQLKDVAKLFYDRLQELDASIHYPWTGVGADDYALANIGQVKNIFGFDPTAIAAGVQPPADPLAPGIILIPIAEYTLAAQGTLNAQVTLADGATLAGLWLNNQLITSQSGNFTISVALIEGLNTFTLKATDNLGRSRAVMARILRDNTPPELSITSPTGGMTISASSINVSGTINDISPIKSLMVNGKPAYLDGATFVSPSVPLVDGANILLVTAIDILGNARTASVSIIAQVPVAPGTTIPLPPVVLTATPIEGNAPLHVSFSIQINAPGVLQKVVYDFEGTRQNFQIMTAPSSIAHVYSEAGDYYPVATVYTTAGVFTSNAGPASTLAERLRIKVSGADSPLVAWNSLKRWIAIGDFSAAGENLSGAHRASITAMLSAIGPELATKMLADFGELQQVGLKDDVAQYATDISTPDGIITFLVDFVNEGGDWKVYSF